MYIIFTIDLQGANMDFIELLSDGYQHRSHNKNLLMAHLIFVTKYRKDLLYGQIRDCVKQLIFSACVKHHWYIRCMETDKDHIHILVQYNPYDSITRIAAVLKQYSTYHLWQNHADILKQHYWKEHTFWSDGYFACSIGQVSREVIERYIANQG